MNKDLNLQQAQKLLDYLANSSGDNKSNFEVLCGLILCFSVQYLEMIIVEMKKNKP